MAIAISYLPRTLRACYLVWHLPYHLNFGRVLHLPYHLHFGRVTRQSSPTSSLPTFLLSRHCTSECRLLFRECSPRTGQPESALPYVDPPLDVLSQSAAQLTPHSPQIYFWHAKGTTAQDKRLLFKLDSTILVCAFHSRISVPPVARAVLGGGGAEGLAQMAASLSGLNIWIQPISQTLTVSK